MKNTRGPISTDMQPHHVALDREGEYTVSTVELAYPVGMFELGYYSERYETMVFRGASWSDLYCERYDTEDAAREGHRNIVRALRRGELDLSASPK